MSVQDVFNVPRTEQEVARWSVLHMILHRDQNRRAFAQKNALLPEFVLDPIDPSPNSTWFNDHQTAHNNIDALYGLPQFDLIDVDWTNETQRIGWIQSHAALHQQETNAQDVFS